MPDLFTYEVLLVYLSPQFHILVSSRFINLQWRKLKTKGYVFGGTFSISFYMQSNWGNLYLCNVEFGIALLVKQTDVIILLEYSLQFKWQKIIRQVLKKL